MNSSIKYQVSSIVSALLLTTGANALDTELRGFVDGRAGVRTQDDPYQDDRSLTELRLQLDSLTYFDWGEFQARGDFLYDDLAEDRGRVDLDNGDGFFDLRELNLLFTPVDWSDVKVGRQILTWGTGDLLFINDLFPKDWNSFLLGRDEEYLKAPSDAVFASFFPNFGTIDVAYMPRFDADRYVDGRRISYWNPGLQRIAGQDTVIDAQRRDEWFRDDELSLRFYRPLRSWEGSLYAYHGYWKSPLGADAGGAYFPGLNVYGASSQGAVGAALANVEIGYYDSLEETGPSKSVPKDEFRFLAGYDREIARDLTAGVQYYLEWMLDYDAYENEYTAVFGTTSTARDEFRHVLTLRLTQMLMNQNLMLGLFTFYSPSDNDAYFRPIVTYRLTDHWMATANGNFFIGEDDHTFFGQFRYNSNINLGIRYSF
jgi:hypothetical protein